MTETSRGSNPQMQDTTQQTLGTTPSSGESIVALPLLSEQKGPISLTLTIDKSVSKVAAWVVAVMTVAIVFAAIATVRAELANIRAETADKRAADMQSFANARFDDLSRQFDVLQRDNRIMGDDMRTIRTYLNLKGVPTSHEEVEEKANGSQDRRKDSR